MSGSPLQPHELETYGTDPSGEDEDPLDRDLRDRPVVGAATGAPAWVVIGIVLTVVFLALLVIAVVWPLLQR